MHPKLPSFLLVTEPQRKPDPSAYAHALAPGSGMILRHYDHPDRAAIARSLQAIANTNRLILIVAADWRLAASLHADGVHLPEGVMRSGILAPMLGWARRHRRLVTAACHSRLALGRAHRLRVSAALLSPVFVTASHPDAKILGAHRFAVLCRSTSLPVYGLGGIRAKSAQSLRRRAKAWGTAATIPLKSSREAGTKPP